MRQKNTRFILTGSVLVLGAIGFFLFMLTMAGKSTDPVALMQVVGQVLGVLIALGATMAVIGYIGKKPPAL